MSFGSQKKYHWFGCGDFSFMNRRRLWCSRKILFRHWTWQWLFILEGKVWLRGSLCKYFILLNSRFPAYLSWIKDNRQEIDCSLLKFKEITEKIVTDIKKFENLGRSCCHIRWQGRPFLLDFASTQLTLSWLCTILSGRYWERSFILKPFQSSTSTNSLPGISQVVYHWFFCLPFSFTVKSRLFFWQIFMVAGYIKLLLLLLFSNCLI